MDRDERKKDDYITKRDFQTESLRRMDAAMGDELLHLDIRRNEFKEFKEEVRRSLNEIKDTLKEQNNIVKGQHEEIIKILAENNVYLKQQQKRQKIANEENLNKIDDYIKENENEIVETLKIILRPGGLRKNFHKIVATNVVLNYNYDGIKGKSAFKEFGNLSSRLPQKKGIPKKIILWKLSMLSKF